MAFIQPPQRQRCISTWHLWDHLPLPNLNLSTDIEKVKKNFVHNAQPCRTVLANCQTYRSKEFNCGDGFIHNNIKIAAVLGYENTLDHSFSKGVQFGNNSRSEF